MATWYTLARHVSEISQRPLQHNESRSSQRRRLLMATPPQMRRSTGRPFRGNSLLAKLTTLWPHVEATVVHQLRTLRSVQNRDSVDGAFIRTSQDAHMTAWPC
jgi:hypothetical protein